MVRKISGLIALFLIMSLLPPIVSASLCYYKETNGAPENYCFVNKTQNKDMKVLNILDKRSFECYYNVKDNTNECDTIYRCEPGIMQKKLTKDGKEYYTNVCIEKIEPICRTLESEMKTDSNGRGYINCKIGTDDSFDLDKSYCLGAVSKEKAYLKPDLVGLENRYYAVVTDLDPKEEVKAFIFKDGKEIECKPSYNKQAAKGSIKIEIGESSSNCQYVFGGAWNIYENPKFCSLPLNFDQPNAKSVTECVWYEQNGCKSGDIGCTIPPIDKIPRQNLCKVYPCSMGKFKESNQKYGTNHYMVCIDRTTKLPAPPLPVKEIGTPSGVRRSIPRQGLKEIIEDSNMNKVVKWMIVDLIKDLEKIGEFIEKNF